MKAVLSKGNLLLEELLLGGVALELGAPHIGQRLLQPLCVRCPDQFELLQVLKDLEFPKRGILKAPTPLTR